MSELRVTDTTVELRLSISEKLGTGLLRTIELQRSSVVDRQIVADPWPYVRGVRLGMSLPGVITYAQIFSRGERTLALVQRGMPALVIELEGEKWDRILLASVDPKPLARALRPVPREH